MKKEIPFLSAIVPIGVTAFLLIVTVLFLHIPLFIPLLIGYIITMIISLKYHMRIRELLFASVQGIKSIAKIFYILLFIGILIAIWSSSGTIDALIYYGLAFIDPKYLVVISFIVSSIVSMFLGTSVGTVSTIGVAFMGMAHTLGISPSVVAGALVSGAFVGDRTSPLSSAAHINAVVTETNYYDMIKELLKTLTPAMVVVTLIYFFIGEKVVHLDSQSKDLILAAREQILQYYGSLSPMLLLPPVIIFLFAFLKVPIRMNLLAGSLIGAVLAYIYQGKGFIAIIQYAIFGFQHPNGSLLGGAWNMFYQVLLIVVVGGFYGILDSSGIMSLILQKMTSSFTNRLSVIRKTLGISISAALFSATQIMGIMIPGRVMLKFYKQQGIDQKLLNRMISDSGIMVAGLIPWNLNAILLGIALHISVVDYVPYAFLLWVLPVISYLQIRWEYAKQEKTTGRKLARNQE